MTIRTLYICYFGLREPLVQTQVLPYLRLLTSDGIHVYLLTFEPKLRQAWTQSEIEYEKKKLLLEGITWFLLPYHKWPSVPATLYDIVKGTLLAWYLGRTEQIDVFHARTHVPALMGALAKRMCGGRLIFDIRGFMPEEYTDAGLWRENGLLYRQVKRIERYLFASSDAFVVLTEKARELLFQGRVEADALGRPIEVIPCCVDLERFLLSEAESKEVLREELQVSERRVIAYVGSFGSWYMTNEMLAFMAFAHSQNPATFALILTQSPPEPIRQRLCQLGLAETDYFVGKVPPEEVPRYLRTSDLAISFIKACYSKQASSPTKIAEFLAAGLPVICNAGVGDLDQLVEQEGVGVLIRGFTPDHFANALHDIDTLLAGASVGDHCREVAAQQFDLVKVGGAKYVRLYRNLLSPNKKV